MLMKKLLIFTLIFILTKCEKLTKEENNKLQSICGTKTGLLSENTRKVLNGVPIKDPIQAPWAVSMVGRSDVAGEINQCSGTLISQRHVLTSRHCFLAEDGESKTNWRWTATKSIWNNVDGCEGDALIVPKEMNEKFNFNFNTSCADYACFIYSISSDLINIKPRKVILPAMCGSNRSPEWYENKDFAIIELEKELIFSVTVFPVCVPKSGFDVKTGNNIWMAGYGRDPKDLKYQAGGVLKYFKWREIIDCETVVGEVGDEWFCTPYSDEQLACEGDSGSGAIQTINEKTTIVGVMAMLTDCNNPDKGANSFVNLTKHIGDICKHAGVCNEGNIKGISIILISIMFMMHQ